MTVEPIPVVGLLTPAPLSLPPDGYTRVTQSIQTGLPFRVDVGTGLALVLIAPTGVATAWRDADPRTVISSAADEAEPFDPSALEGSPTAPPARMPLRVLVVSGGRALAAVPLRAGRLRLAPDGGADDAGTLLEIVVLGWELHAGTLRGAGDVGSTIDLAWRRADKPADTFEPPPPNPHVVERAGPYGFYKHGKKLRGRRRG
jgi:hypothetical protein